MTGGNGLEIVLPSTCCCCKYSRRLVTRQWRRPNWIHGGATVDGSGCPHSCAGIASGNSVVPVRPYVSVLYPAAIDDGWMAFIDKSESGWKRACSCGGVSRGTGKIPWDTCTGKLRKTVSEQRSLLSTEKHFSPNFDISPRAVRPSRKCFAGRFLCSLAHGVYMISSGRKKPRGTIRQRPRTRRRRYTKHDPVESPERNNLSMPPVPCWELMVYKEKSDDDARRNNEKILRKC